MTTSQSLLDNFLSRGGFPSGTIAVTDSNPQTDRRLGTELPFLMGTFNGGREVRVVIDMLPDKLKEAVTNQQDITGATMTGAMSAHDGNWYAFLLMPNVSLEVRIEISTKGGEAKGAPQVTLFEECGFVEMKTHKSVVIKKREQLETEERRAWPENIRRLVIDALERWENSKTLAANEATLELLIAGFHEVTSDIGFDLEHAGNGVIQISFSGEPVSQCYLADLQDNLLVGAARDARIKLNDLLGM